MPRKKAIQIRIPQPCEASRTAFQPQGEHHFCSQCQKTIIDFSRMSDAEIGRIMSQGNAPTCGRFRRSQLDRPITYQATLLSGSWPRIAAGAMLLMLAMPHALLAQAPVAASTELVTQERPLANSPLPVKPKGGGEDSTFVLKGHLIHSETGEAISFANVANRELGLATTSNDSGYFMLPIPASLRPDTLSLEVRWRGDLHGIQIALDRNATEGNVSVALFMQEMLVDGVMISQKVPREIELNLKPKSQRRNQKEN
jgi:hypothetical protein